MLEQRRESMALSLVSQSGLSAIGVWVDGMGWDGCVYMGGMIGGKIERGRRAGGMAVYFFYFFFLLSSSLFALSAVGC